MSLKIDRRLNPCRGGEGKNFDVCTTARGDLICKGCLRTAENVDLWLTYSDEKKIAIMKRIEERVVFTNGNFPS